METTTESCVASELERGVLVRREECQHVLGVTQKTPHHFQTEYHVEVVRLHNGLHTLRPVQGERECFLRAGEKRLGSRAHGDSLTRHLSVRSVREKRDVFHRKYMTLADGSVILLAVQNERDGADHVADAHGGPVAGEGLHSRERLCRMDAVAKDHRGVRDDLNLLNRVESVRMSVWMWFRRDS